MPSRAQITKIAHFRQAVIATLKDHSGQSVGLDEIQRAVKVAEVKIDPSRVATILRQMAQNGLVAKTGYARYAAVNGASHQAATQQLGFVQRLARIEHMLELLLRALEVEER